LFEIGAVALVVTKGNPRRSVRPGDGQSAGTVPREGDGRGVLVELGPSDGELLDRVPDQGRERAGSVGTLQMIGGTAEAVIVEQHGLPGQQAEGRRDTPRRPVGQGVRGLAGRQQVGDQQAQDGGGGQGRRASGQHREVPLAQAMQIEPLQEVPGQGGGADFEGLQVQLAGPSRSQEILASKSRGR
jgi:hypothetical protein